MYVAKDAVAKLMGTELKNAAGKVSNMSHPWQKGAAALVSGAGSGVRVNSAQQRGGGTASSSARLRVFALRVRVSVCERGFACACVCLGWIRRESLRPCCELLAVRAAPAVPRALGRRGPLDQDASALNL